MANEINGTDLYVFSNGVVIAHATSHTLSPKMTTRKTTNKDSGIFETSAAGRLAVTASCDGLMVYGDIQTLRAAFIARTPLALDFGQQTAGGALDSTFIYAMGNFLLTGLDETAPDAGNATYKASFELSSGFSYVASGALTCRIAHTDNAGQTLKGCALVMPTGGVAPYTYAWTGAGIVSPVNLQYIVAQPNGTYTCVVTDATTGTHLTATATVVIS